MVAAAGDPVLSVLDDESLLRAAAADARCLVTENVRDFDRIARAWSARGEHHRGIVFTSPRRFHRGSRSYPESLHKALARLPDDPPRSTRDWVHWLQ